MQANLWAYFWSVQCTLTTSCMVVSAHDCRVEQRLRINGYPRSWGWIESPESGVATVEDIITIIELQGDNVLYSGDSGDSTFRRFDPASQPGIAIDSQSLRSSAVVGHTTWVCVHTLNICSQVHMHANFINLLKQTSAYSYLPLIILNCECDRLITEVKQRFIILLV